jgi:hypothetical protein
MDVDIHTPQKKKERKRKEKKQQQQPKDSTFCPFRVRNL